MQPNLKTIIDFVAVWAFVYISYAWETPAAEISSEEFVLVTLISFVTLWGLTTL